MKKLLTVLILLSTIFLSACSKTNDKQITIKFSSWGSRTEYAILKEVINKYENLHPNIKIEFIHVPENYFRKLHLLFASKSEPDVLFINNTYAPLYINAGLLQDLSQIINEQDFYESSINCFKYNEKIYAIPRDISNLVLYINKDIIKNPEKIKDIYTLKEVAKIVSGNGIFGLNYEKQPLFWLYFLEYFNGGILSDDGKEIIFNSEESIKGLKFYADMINKDRSIPFEWQMSGMTSAQMFINGKIAMYLSGRWMIPKFREAITFDWDIIPFPVSDNSKILTDSSGWAVAKSSKHKNEAYNFVKYLSSEETSILFAKTGLITPARIDASKSKEFLAPELKPHNSEVFTQILKNSKPTPVNENYAQIIDIVTKSVNPVLNGKIDANETMSEFYIKKLKKYCEK